FQAIEPAVDDGPECAQEAVCCGKLFHCPAVNRFQSMEWGFRLGDLHLGGCKALLLGVLLHPTREERLAATVIATNRLEHGPALSHVRHLLGDGGLETAQANGKEIQPTLRHSAFPQCGDDLASA